MFVFLPPVISTIVVNAEGWGGGRLCVRRAGGHAASMRGAAATSNCHSSCYLGGGLLEMAVLIRNLDRRSSRVAGEHERQPNFYVIITRGMYIHICRSRLAGDRYQLGYTCSMAESDTFPGCLWRCLCPRRLQYSDPCVSYSTPVSARYDARPPAPFQSHRPIHQ